MSQWTSAYVFKQHKQRSWNTDIKIMFTLQTATTKLPSFHYCPSWLQQSQSQLLFHCATAEKKQILANPSFSSIVVWQKMDRYLSILEAMVKLTTAEMQGRMCWKQKAEHASIPWAVERTRNASSIMFQQFFPHKQEEM